MELKALPKILVTVSGIVINFKFGQFSKHNLPIVVSGVDILIFTEFRFVQPVKHLSPKVVSEVPHMNVVRFVQAAKLTEPIVVTELGSVNWPVTPEQSLKARLLIVVTVLGRVNEVTLFAPQKASTPILPTI